MGLKIVLCMTVLFSISYAHSINGHYQYGGSYDEYDDGHTYNNGHYGWGYIGVPAFQHKFTSNQYWSPPQQSFGYTLQNQAEENFKYKDWAQYAIVPSIQTVHDSRTHQRVSPVQSTQIPQTTSQPYVPPTPSTELRQQAAQPIELYQPEQKLSDISQTSDNSENVTSTSGDLETTTDVSVENRINANCAPYTPGQKPNFSAPNRRISLTKCYEYIWEIKVLTEKSARERDCLRIPGVFHISVVGGHNTIAGEYPHMAAIGWTATLGSWIFKCGGSLISPKFVLTAGHCISASPRDTTIADVVPKIVRLGDKNILDSSMVKDVNIQRIIKHPLYNAPRKYNDIALFELEQEVEFTTFISPACIYTQTGEFSSTQKGTVTGWGVIEADGTNNSPELQAAEVDFISTEECKNIYGSICHRHWCGLQDSQLCAGALTGGIDTCQGDSGGPLQVRINLQNVTDAVIYNIIGVTSFGFKCARVNSPGIYTRVASYVDWIEDIVWP